MLEQEAAEIIGRIVAVRGADLGIHPDRFSQTFIEGCVYMYTHPGGSAPIVETAVAVAPDSDEVRRCARAIWFEIVEARKREMGSLSHRGS